MEGGCSNAGFECRPNWHLALVVGVISLGLALMVKGETQFDLLGFVLVMTASMLSGLRWTITQVLLQGGGGEGGHGGNFHIFSNPAPSPPTAHFYPTLQRNSTHLHLRHFHHEGDLWPPTLKLFPAFV